MVKIACKRLFLHVSAPSARLCGLPKFESFCVRFFSSVSSALPRTVSPRHERDTLTLCYLINSCGLDPEAANVAAKKVSLKSAKNPDLVLALLREHGFSDAHITKLIYKMPGLLSSSPERTLLPKLEFFLSVGMSPLLISQVVCLSPCILRCSLKRRIIPFHNYLKELLHSDKKILRVYKRASMHYLSFAMSRVPPNVSILRKCGVSESNISFLLVHHPRSLMTRAERLVESIEKVVGLGIDVSKLMFVQAIQVLQSVGKSGWERKRQIYGRWGWSESDILNAFSIHSICMSLSEKKISSAMEFLVKEMNYHPQTIASSPTVLFYSLKNRIVPRCRVVQVLMARGHVKKSYSIVTLVSMTEKRFKDKFIAAHLENVPQLLDVYCGKLSVKDLGLSSSELARVKLL